MKMEVIEKLKSVYGENEEKIRLFFAPGRVNLIGEHTDYNGGYVFPCALNFGTYAAIRKRNDNNVYLATKNFDLRVKVDLDNIIYEKKHGWGNYPKGVIKMLRDSGYDFSGFEVVFGGNIPNGAGLSSSASIEIATAAAVNGIFNLGIDMIDLVKLCQRAENEFCSVNCGIMDQFATGMGKKDSAIFLKCDTLEYKYVPLKLSGYRLVISNTNKRRGLQDSKYNERRRECEEALACLNKKQPFENLGQVSLRDFESLKDNIDSETVLKRAHHIVYEDDRVLNAIKALNSNDITAFGKLMTSSHESLRDYYEVTGIELDTLVEEALKLDFVAGSRMTGAGFGGCTISIVKEDRVNDFIEIVSKNYENKIGYKPTMYIAEVGDGAGEIEY